MTVENVHNNLPQGTYALSSGYYDAYYSRAQQMRSLVRRELCSMLEVYDVMLTPAAATPPYMMGEKCFDPLTMYVGDIMTVNVNLAGLPAIVMTTDTKDVEGEVPIGVQLIGRAFGEADLLELAHIFEISR